MAWRSLGVDYSPGFGLKLKVAVVLVFFCMTPAMDYETGWRWVWEPCSNSIHSD